VGPSAGRITVSEWTDQWLNGARNLKQGGLDTYRRGLDRHVLPALGQLPLARLTTAEVDDYLTVKLDAGYSASTVHRHYRTLHRLCEVAIERGKITRNPCGPVVPPRIGEPDMRFLSAEEVEALAGAISKRYRDVGVHGGLRGDSLIRRGRPAPPQCHRQPHHDLRTARQADERLPALVLVGPGPA
jgi:site-specific recombinase XerD